MHLRYLVFWNTSEILVTPDILLELQACLKEIHTNMLRKHLERLETPSDGENIKTEQAEELEEQESDQDVEGINIGIIFYLHS